MKILFLSDNFPPETNAPANRVWEHARLWAAERHRVAVLTTAPNFPRGVVFEGYRNAWRTVEARDGVRIVRFKSYIAPNRGRVRRTLDYLSFVPGAVLVGLAEERPDVVVATSPQFFCALAGWLLAALRRRPFVFELRDLWPRSITAVGAMKPGPGLRMVEALELFLYRRAALIVAVSPGFVEDLTSRGIDGTKIRVVTNGVDRGAFAPLARDAALARELGLTGKVVVGYVGTHGMAHALGQVLEAAKRLADRDDIRFLLVGDGAERAALERKAEEEGIANAVLLPPQPRGRMPAIWSLCDVALISPRDTPTFAGVIPSKIFEAMAMGLPSLVSVPAGVATRLVEAEGAGLAVPPENPEALAAAVRDLADHPERRQAMGAAARKAAEKYDRKRLAREMLDELLAVGEGRRA